VAVNAERLATNAPMPAILCSGCFGKPDLSASNSSAWVASGLVRRRQIQRRFDQVGNLRRKLECCRAMSSRGLVGQDHALKQDRIDGAAFARPSDHGQRLEALTQQSTARRTNLFGSFTPYGCVSFLAARIPAATVSRSHMYAPCLVVP
jgi:hypothetical protein